MLHYMEISEPLPDREGCMGNGVEIIPYAIGPIITAKDARNNADPIVHLRTCNVISYCPAILDTQT
jgi:hypothetical protein